ncbi:MAG TPA: HmuY family protein [Candidatus Nanopelagicales bacterium]|nr:HmuY family protein [Candidatus Nanopelagicales bacterium]
MNPWKRLCVAALAPLFCAACSEEVGKQGPNEPPPPSDDPGVPLAVEVPASGRVFVDLAAPAVVEVGDPGASTGWDIAFEGWDVFTNGGASGPGEAGGFPLDPEEYSASQLPAVPFLLEDETGGAFADWYVYDPSEHVVWSRYHVYGVEDGGRTWKVQIYTFYGEVQGAPVSAVYQIRYAEVTDAGPGATVELLDVDATAGGSEAPESAPSACLDLATGAMLMLTPAEASGDTSWDLCFRRALIGVNGELGGPGSVRAVDLHQGESGSETLAIVKGRTKETEAGRFDGIGWAELTDPALNYRGDRIISAFSDRWADLSAAPPRPADVAWLVQGADGGSQYLLKVESFEGGTESSPGTVNLRVRKMF